MAAAAARATTPTAGRIPQPRSRSRARRPMTPCTLRRGVGGCAPGQWADLPLETLCRKAKDFGYDGLELACWGDHFEVSRALSDESYCARKRELLQLLAAQGLI